MSISRLIIGGLMSIFGLWFILFVGFIDGPGVDFVGIFTGLILLAFGIVILFNKEEDEIEARVDVASGKTKSLNKKKSKKKYGA